MGRKLRIDKDLTMSIPATIHQIWIPAGPTDRPSPFHVACSQRMMELHPKWRFCAWTDDSLVRALLPSTFTKLIQGAWERFAGDIKARSDLMRLCVLYAFGGIYVDWDVWALKPFDDFLVANDELILGVNSYDPLIVGEHVIGAAAGSEKIAKVIEHLCSQEVGVDGHYSPHIAKFVHHLGWEAYPPEVFCPHLRDASEDELYRTTENTFAIHCYSPRGYDLSRLRSLTEVSLVH